MQTQNTETVNVVIDDLLDALGIGSFENMDIGDRFKIENGAFMDLYVEKPVQNHLTISHYRDQDIDLAPDPSFGFALDGDADETRFIPVKLRQQTPFGSIDTYHNPDGLNEGWELLDAFLTNIRKQGFIEAATPDAKVTENP